MDDLMQKLQSVLNDKESMQQLQELASMLTSGSEGQSEAAAPPADDAAPPFDIGKLMQLQSIMSSAGKPDKNIALLQALRPLLKEENQIKLDRIVKLFRLMSVWPLIKESGLLGGDLFG